MSDVRYCKGVYHVELSWQFIISQRNCNEFTMDELNLVQIYTGVLLWFSAIETFWF